MYHLGCGTAIAFAEENNLLPATGEFGGQGADHSVTLQQDPSVARYWLVITSACTYDGKPDAAAASLLDFAVKSDKISLLQEHLSWWKQFWQASSIDLYGKDADTLMRLWYTGHYSYASVAGGKTLPKFNGGPGLIQRDERSWGWGYWWQNTREQIWPMFAANRLNYVHDALQFYDGTFMECKTSTAIQGKLGIRMDEAVTPRKTDSPVPEKQISKFDSAALEKAMADLTMENKKSYYNVRSLAQSTELTQMMYDYVAYTGDSDFLMKSVAPWLKETTLFWMSYLRKGEDGLYHSMVTDAAEMWWKIKDSSIDLSACRYCFWHVLNDGSTFGYEPEFIAAVTDRADHLAPLPVGSWTHKNLKPGEVVEGLPPGAKATTLIDRTANCYAPAGDLYDDRVSHNVENPELYLVYPFAMVDANSEKSDFDRAVNTFRRRRMPNHSGWSQCPVEAVRLRLDDAVDVIMDHVDRHQKYPYGEWNSPAGKLKGSSLAVTDTPYFDAMGVNLTAVQEALLQSHQLTTPEKTDLLGGGPIVLVPAVRNDWSGKFKLRARGGFNVTVEFEPGKKVTRATVECERGGKLRLANPFGVCDVIRAGKTAKNADPMIILQTQPGEYIDFIWKPIPANSK